MAAYKYTKTTKGWTAINLDNPADIHLMKEDGTEWKKLPPDTVGWFYDVNDPVATAMREGQHVQPPQASWGKDVTQEDQAAWDESQSYGAQLARKAAYEEHYPGFLNVLSQPLKATMRPPASEMVPPPAEVQVSESLQAIYDFGGVPKKGSAEHDEAVGHELWRILKGEKEAGPEFYHANQDVITRLAEGGHKGAGFSKSWRTKPLLESLQPDIKWPSTGELREEHPRGAMTTEEMAEKKKRIKGLPSEK